MVKQQKKMEKKENKIDKKVTLDGIRTREPERDQILSLTHLTALQQVFHNIKSYSLNKNNVIVWRVLRRPHAQSPAPLHPRPAAL